MTILLLFHSEISEWNLIVQVLSRICSALLATHQNSETGCLFSKNDSCDNELFRTLKEVDQKPFYGKNIGFQFVSSMRPILMFMVVSMACYFSFYFKTKPKMFRIMRYPISFVKHCLMSKKRAVKAVEAYQGSTTEFCKVSNVLNLLNQTFTDEFSTFSHFGS